MRNFNRNDRSHGGRKFVRRGFGRDSARQMFKATCSRCGNECEVPFKPTGDKPVFCSQCFEDYGGSDSRRSQGKSFGRSKFDRKRMYEAVCDNCGNKCTVPFQPHAGKPVYCSQCFEDKKDKGGRNTEQYKEQFEALNTKLDKILKMLTPKVSTAVAQEEKTVTRRKNSARNRRASKKQANKTEKKSPSRILKGKKDVA